jgi:GT2 family glycosyltransferase
MIKSAAIVVTFNREIQLIECLKAIQAQTEVPSQLIIIDNHSSEKTYKSLFKNKFISIIPENIPVEDQIIKSKIFSTRSPDVKIPILYVRKRVNDGGAGGFYAGMKLAYDEGADWLWMMDDDGIPNENQLQELIKGANQYGLSYANALVTNIEDESQLAFTLGSFKSAQDAKSKEIIHNLMSPFNGTLITRDLIDKIGLIKREMFIWGDETEYTNRVRKNGFKIGTITSALHSHPLMRGKFTYALPLLNKFKIIIKPVHFSHFYYRNLGYNQQNYGSLKSTIVLYSIYIFYFSTRFKFKELRKFSLFYKDGVANKFDRK